MLSFQLSAVGRRALGAASVASLIAVAACSDETTAPRPAVIPEGPSAAILMRSLVTVQVKTIWGNLLPEKAKVVFIVIGGADITVEDNDLNDKNGTVGVITAAMPWMSQYTVCLKEDTPSYAIDKTKPYCNTVPGFAKTVDAGSLVMRQFPIAGFYMQNLAGASITGGKIKLTAPPSDGFEATAADVNGIDLSATNDGKIVFKANRPGTYTWCELTAPTGYYLTSPSCGTIDLSWDVGTGMILKHKKVILVVKPS